MFKSSTYQTLQEQVGGKHYKGMKIQPAEFINENHLEFAEGCVIKYVCRHKKKDGEQCISNKLHNIINSIFIEFSSELP